METTTERWALGVDPGETTGLVEVRFLGDRAEAAWRAELPWEEAAQQVRHRSGRPGIVVACERFMVNAKTAQRGQPYVEAAVGMVGVCREWAGLNGAELVLETASAGKKGADDRALRALGLHAPGRRHSNDAARQAVLLASKRRWVHARALL